MVTHYTFHMISATHFAHMLNWLHISVPEITYWWPLKHLREFRIRIQQLQQEFSELRDVIDRAADSLFEGHTFISFETALHVWVLMGNAARL